MHSLLVATRKGLFTLQQTAGRAAAVAVGAASLRNLSICQWRTSVG